MECGRPGDARLFLLQERSKIRGRLPLSLEGLARAALVLGLRFQVCEFGAIALPTAPPIAIFAACGTKHDGTFLSTLCLIVAKLAPHQVEGRTKLFDHDADVARGAPVVPGHDPQLRGSGVVVRSGRNYFKQLLNISRMSDARSSGTKYLPQVRDIISHRHHTTVGSLVAGKLLLDDAQIDRILDHLGVVRVFFQVLHRKTYSTSRWG